VARFDELHPDPPLSAEQKKLVGALSQSQIDTVDRAILSSSVAHWRKVARVVSSAMAQVGQTLPGVPDVFYAERVRTLVERGALDHKETLGACATVRFARVKSNKRIEFAPFGRPTRKQRCCLLAAHPPR
jgi:hypothetical protein